MLGIDIQEREMETEWKAGFPATPPKSKRGEGWTMEAWAELFEVRFTTGGAVWHRPKGNANEHS